MRRHQALLFTFLLLIPIAAAARQSDPDFRACELEAYMARSNKTFDATAHYHSTWFNILAEQRQRYFELWEIENDRDRGNVQRDIDNNIRTRLRDADKIYKNDLRTISNEFRNDERNCTAQYNARIKSVPTGLVCFSSDVCNAPLGICSIETGTCIQACEPGSNPCNKICSGKCKVR